MATKYGPLIENSVFYSIDFGYRIGQAIINIMRSGCALAVLISGHAPRIPAVCWLYWTWVLKSKKFFEKINLEKS